MAGATPDIRLRATVAGDVPTLFEMQLDPVSNQLAGTKPRDERTFHARWEVNLREPSVTPRVIVVEGVVVGSIDKFRHEGVDSIGYWIAREHWGRGIATRAIALLLDEVPTRPLFARVAAHNTASLRALQRNGFSIRSRELSPATERYIGCETIGLMLA